MGLESAPCCSPLWVGKIVLNLFPTLVQLLVSWYIAVIQLRVSVGILCNFSSFFRSASLQTES